MEETRPHRQPSAIGRVRRRGGEEEGRRGGGPPAVYDVHVHVYGHVGHAKLEFRWYRDTCLALCCLIQPTATELPR